MINLNTFIYYIRRPLSAQCTSLHPLETTDESHAGILGPQGRAVAPLPHARLPFVCEAPSNLQIHARGRSIQKLDTNEMVSLADVSNIVVT